MSTVMLFPPSTTAYCIYILKKRDFLVTTKGSGMCKSVMCHADMPPLNLRFMVLLPCTPGVSLGLEIKTRPLLNIFSFTSRCITLVSRVGVKYVPLLRLVSPETRHISLSSCVKYHARCDPYTGACHRMSRARRRGTAAEAGSCETL